jgi:hypothetical protein
MNFLPMLALTRLDLQSSSCAFFSKDLRLLAFFRIFLNSQGFFVVIKITSRVIISFGDCQIMDWTKNTHGHEIKNNP